MWFIFPQIRGLGSSPMAKKFAISSMAEASAYLHHPVLGPRLTSCTLLVNAIEDRPIEEIFGYPDHLKFHSSMTLFARAASHDPTFQPRCKSSSPASSISSHSTNCRSQQTSTWLHIQQGFAGSAASQKS